MLPDYSHSPVKLAAPIYKKSIESRQQVTFRRLETPVCRMSEDRWWEYLCLAMLAQEPLKTEQVSIYNPATQEIQQTTAIQKGKQKVTERDTLLCLSGPLAGMLCASMPEQNDDLERYWYSYIPKNSVPQEVDGVALRWVRRQYRQPLARLWQLAADSNFPHKKYLEHGMQHNTTDWFLNSLTIMLDALEVEYERTTLYRNAIMHVFLP